MADNEAIINEENYEDKPTLEPVEYKDLSYTNIEEESKAKDNLKHDILLELGYPLITVELTDEQMNHAIEDAVMIYTKYASFEPKYLGIDLGRYVDGEGINLKNFHISVIKDIAFGPPHVFGLSTSELAFGYSGYISQSSHWVPFDFVSLQCLHEFREMAQRMLAPKPDWTFNPRSGILKIIPEPRYVYKKWWNERHDRHCGPIPAIVDCEIEPPLWELYSYDYVRRLAAANAKVLLGTIRSKFSGITLPGGGQIDGASLRQEGAVEVKELVDNIRSENYGNNFIIV